MHAFDATLSWDLLKYRFIAFNQGRQCSIMGKELVFLPRGHRFDLTGLTYLHCFRI
uniref:Uncharacterized protein n=1 Tax=Anguilla anguilla TaxID=7936 RepID=A0A0E9PM60_ANGAN